MTKKTEDKHRNKVAGKTSKLIRWDDTLLAETLKKSEEMGITWSAFIQNAAREALKKQDQECTEKEHGLSGGEGL